MSDQPAESATYHLRAATPEDAAVIAHHRAAMFYDMGFVSRAEAEQIAAAATPQLAARLAAGEYLGRLTENAGQVVAGGGMILRSLLPRPGALSGGEEAYILNVYTEPPHRGRGVARMVMRALLASCEERGVARVLLHASDAGRPLYESLNFVATNEMRLHQATPV